MAYHVPTPLESFVPPPALHIPRPTQSASTYPWSGTFIVSGMRASDIRNSQEISITAVDLDGVTRPRYCDLWPKSLMFSITPPDAVPIHHQLQRYLDSKPPSVTVATFLPAKLRDPNANVVNQTKFRTFARFLWDRQLVAVVAFPLPSQEPSPPNSPSASSRSGRGAGLLIYTVPTSTSLLIGAGFMTEPFPDFVYSAQATPLPRALNTAVPSHPQFNIPTSQGVHVPPHPTPSSSYHSNHPDHSFHGSATTSSTSHHPVPPHYESSTMSTNTNTPYPVIYYTPQGYAGSNTYEAHYPTIFSALTNANTSPQETTNPSTGDNSDK